MESVRILDSLHRSEGQRNVDLAHSEGPKEGGVLYLIESGLSLAGVTGLANHFHQSPSVGELTESGLPDGRVRR